MRTPYTIGSVRTCVMCGAEFKRQVRRTSYCADCEKVRMQERNRARARRPRVKGGVRIGDTRLPGRTREQERVLRVTHITFLPSCSVCHRYGDDCPDHHHYG